jgi:transcriptional regulator with XRE-family HTH domain
MAATDRQTITTILASIEAVRVQQRITRHTLANRLGIPFNTFRAWFHQRGAKTPSKEYLVLLERYCQGTDTGGPPTLETWQNIVRWWKTQDKPPSVDQLAAQLGCAAEDLKGYLEGRNTPPLHVVEQLSKLLRPSSIEKGSDVAEAKRNTRLLRALLSALAEELVWFRNGSVQARHILRSELDFVDVGYVSSLRGIPGT